MRINSPTTIISLHRRYLFQIRLLPLGYLQQFFRIKVADDLRAILGTSNECLRHQKFKRVSKDLRKMEAANRGSVKAFNHILDLAYGRKGKLKWEIMKPLLSDPNAPIPPRIILAEPKSQPPVYSPELTALLTSPISRDKKHLDTASLVSPPTLPERANPLSEEARLLGPFSKRREVNIRWRFFTTEWKKILPPLQVALQGVSSPNDSFSQVSDKESLARAGIRAVGMQGAGVFEEIEKLAAPLPATLTRRQRNVGHGHTGMVAPSDTSTKTRLPRRWLRRRFRLLLARLPILTYSQEKQCDPGKYRVSLSQEAIVPSRHFGGKRQAEVDDVDVTWLQRAEQKG